MEVTVRCEHCGVDLMRVVVEWEDGSLSILWRCACVATEDDNTTVELGRAVAETSTNKSCTLDTRGWA
jgi:phage FluMu protein Com